ncbi:hypothetical protein KC19_12G134600 [Ceratodon purpureus]|uniref:Mediator complex subunit 22 n=1 Tax=Ceratodon purpureus TaxID=3225 RepID=A0A8T0GAW0_CERPU|nr:hypothetical protein KC19_12G134600 [Ceratodon purpureus]
MNKGGNAGGQGGGVGNFGPGGVAGPTAAAAAQAAQRQRSLLQRADADIGSLLDNFSHLLKAARINDPVRNAQEAFQMEVHAARVVQAADSLLKLVSELKQSAVFSDFLSLNRSINQRIVKFGELSEDTDKLLLNIGEEVAASLQELESHYYASPYRTLETDTELFQPSSNSDGG